MYIQRLFTMFVQIYKYEMENKDGRRKIVQHSI